jgi:hypothetical protein
MARHEEEYEYEQDDHYEGEHEEGEYEGEYEEEYEVVEEHENTLGVGKRRAVIIGINYFETDGELGGCINDANFFLEYLQEYEGFNEDTVWLLTDDQQEGEYVPTKENIMNALDWLVEDCQPGDSLVLFYAGHGASVEDDNGDESDGKDEALCPVDYEENGMIPDDFLNEHIVKKLPVGCRLTAIFDCCHSGSIMDLPYKYSAKGSSGGITRHFKGQSNIIDGLTSAVKNLAIGALTGKKKAKKSQSAALKAGVADIVMISGCKDHQTSADAHIEGESRGAMTWGLLKALRESETHSISLIKLLTEIRGHLAGGFEQLPELSTAYEIDPKTYEFSVI